MSTGNRAPEIELTVEALRAPRRLHVAIVMAAMVWPDSLEWRTRALKTALALDGRERLEAGEALSRAYLVELVHAALYAPSPVELHAESRERIRRGVVAGVVLWDIVAAAADRGLANTLRASGHGSIADILHAADRVLGGKAASASEHLKKVAWRTFRPVAHYWAAASLWADPDSMADQVIRSDSGASPITGPGEDAAGGWLPCRSASLPAFLAIAQALQEAGERTRLRHRADPILPPGESVKLPQAVIDVLPPVHLTIGKH